MSNRQFKVFSNSSSQEKITVYVSLLSKNVIIMFESLRIIVKGDLS